MMKKNVSLVQDRAGPRDAGCLALFYLRFFNSLSGLLRVVRYLRKTTNTDLISC